MNAEMLRSLPAGTMFSRDAVLEMLRERDASPVRWLKLSVALGVMQQADESLTDRKLRRLCAKWERQQLRGHVPEVRVARNSTASEAGWLLDESMLQVWRPLPMAVVEDCDDEDELAGRIARAILRDEGF